MLAIAAIAINVHLVMRGEGGTVGFAIGYVVVRSLLVSLYVRARLHVRGQGRRLIDLTSPASRSRPGSGSSRSSFPEPYRFLLWGVRCNRPLGHAAGLGGAHRRSDRHLAPDRALRHLLHHRARRRRRRRGGGGGRLEFRFESWVVGGLCFLVALALWWIYFDLADTSVVGPRSARAGLRLRPLPVAGGGRGFRGRYDSLRSRCAADPASARAPAGRSRAGSRRSPCLSPRSPRGRVDLASGPHPPRPVPPGRRLAALAALGGADPTRLRAPRDDGHARPVAPGGLHLPDGSGLGA